MREQYLEYRDGETLLEGFLCYDEALPGPRPAVIINHAWESRDEYVERKGFTEPKVRDRVLMLHGYDDPLAPIVVPGMHWRNFWLKS